MQDLKTIIKPEYIEFEPHNLVTPWCVRDRHMALWAKHQQPRLYPEEMSLFSVLQDMPTHLRENAINIPIFYLPERNLLLITSNKAGMSSVNQMVQKMEKLRGEVFERLSSHYRLLELIDECDPEIWHLYRDPLSRMVSYFYFIGNQVFQRQGVRWSWEGVDMYVGDDPHRLPQFAYLPGHFEGENINQRIRMHLKQQDYTNIGDRHVVPSDVWAYPFLSHFVPHKKVKFFWLHERDLTYKTDAIELIHQRLDFEYDKCIHNTNIDKPDLKDIPLKYIQKIWQSQQPEREFLSKLKWENGPIQFIH